MLFSLPCFMLISLTSAAGGERVVAQPQPSPAIPARIQSTSTHSANEGKESQHRARVSSHTQAPLNTGFLADTQVEDINGRIFVGTLIHGFTRDNAVSRRRGEDNAARYGAAGASDSIITLRTPGLFGFDTNGFVAQVNPWQPVTAPSASPYSNPFTNANTKLAARLESARQQWLKDNNFTGGVRTFVNDAALFTPARAGAQITPRATMELAPDMPRVRSKIQVRSSPTSTKLKSANAATRVQPKITKVLPPSAAKPAPIDLAPKG